MKPHKIESPVDLHTPAQRAFLSDGIENCEQYADGFAPADAPLPVTLSWDADAPGPFTVRVSENEDLTGARVFTTDAPTLDVYNLKIGARYYWTVNEETPESFTTADAAPRNLSVGGVMNVRDLGGWKTVDGRRVRQGSTPKGSGRCGNSGSGRRSTCASVTTATRAIPPRGKPKARSEKASATCIVRSCSDPKTT